MKREWKTTLRYSAPRPQEALALLLEDQYALLIAGTIYVRPVYVSTDLTLSDRKVTSWEAVTEVTLLGELEDD